MIRPLVRTTLAVGVVAALAACGGGETHEDTSFVAQNLLWSVDSGGNVNVFADDGASRFTHVKSFQPKNALEKALVLGEVHFNAGKAYVIIQSGLVDTKGTADTTDDVKTGGGVAVYDVQSQTLENIVPLVSEKTGNESRIVHTYKDPNGNYLWLNNDGPSASGLVKPVAPADTATQAEKDAYQTQLDNYNARVAEAAENDSVFRLNWDASDTEGDDKYLAIVEIHTGNGHKKGALSYKSTVAGQAEALPFYGVHNGDQSLSIIGNDPDNADAYLKVAAKYDNNDTLRTWSLLSTKEITNSDGSTRLAKNSAHGMGYSPFSGKFYVGITSGEDLGMAIVDAKSTNLTLSSIAAGTDANQIPAGGYVKVSHDGKSVYTIGSKTITVNGAQEKHSFLSIIGAEPNGADTVKQVIDLGEITASSLNIAEYDHDGHTEVKLFIPSSAGGHHKNVVKVVELDHETGVQKENTEITTINVGMAQDHRNGFAHEGHRFAYYPNGGDCAAAQASTTGGHPNHKAKVSARHAGERHDCRTVSVIDIHTNQEVYMFTTHGDKPGALNAVDVKDLNIRVDQHDDMH